MTALIWKWARPSAKSPFASPEHGRGINFEIQPYRYAFVSCANCGYTEVYNLKTLEGKDNVGTFLEVLFAD
jgi:predicted nucleic-acid-binding Zn-ribbon protein